MKNIYLFLFAIAFTTYSVAQTQILSQPLTNGSLPAGWTQTDVTFSTASGGYANFTTAAAVLTTPTFNASAFSSIRVNFDVAKFGTGGDGPLTIQYSLNSGTTWFTAANSTTPTDATYQSNSITINQVSATMRVRFLRSASPSQKRLRNVVINGFGSPCTTYSLPFTEGFENGVPPICWAKYRGTNGLGTAQDWMSSTTAQTGARAAVVNFENVTGGLAQDWLVTPAIDLTGSTANSLTFWARDQFTQDFGTSYTVRVSTTSQTNIASFTTVQTYTETQLGNTYNQKTVNLSAFSGNVVYIAFVMEQDDGDNWFLDNVSVVDSGGCTPPSTQASAFSATNVNAGTGSATLNWTRGNGNNVLVVMRASSPVNTDPSIGTVYTANSTFGSGQQIGAGNFVVYNGPASSVDISNLTPNVTYHVAIYEYNTTGTCYNLTELTGSFLVTCGSYPVPFTEGFEGAFPPTCWTTYRGANGLGTFQDWQTTNFPVHSGTTAAYVEFETVIGDVSEDWLVTPAIDLTTVPSSQLKFWTTDNDPIDYGSIYTIRVSTTSQTDRNSFTTIQTYTETQLGATYNEKTIPLSAFSSNSTVYIAFVLTQSDGDSWYLDDVSVEELAVAVDNNSQVSGPTTQVAATTIAAANTTTVGTATNAFSFTIDDTATTDALPTNVTRMRFVPGPNNTADWTDALQGITLTDENAVTYTPTVTISDTEIILDFASPVVIANGTSLEFTLGFYLNTTSIADGSIVQFQVSGTSSGFEADNTGSGFADPFPSGNTAGNNITIDVVATQLVFGQQPSDVEVNQVMTPVVFVNARDANGNLDTGYNEDVEITSTGSLSGSPVTSTAVNGLAIFNSLVHTLPGQNLTLIATDTQPGVADVVSNTFNVVPAPVVIAIQDFDGTTPNWPYSSDVAFFDNGWGTDGYFGIIDIASAAPINQSNMSANILGENDLDDEGDNGTTGFATITFANVGMTGYTNSVLTFDWQVIGYNAVTDDAAYEVFYNGVGQGQVFLVDGGVSPQNGQGTVTLNIPNGLTTFSLELRIRDNGATGFSGFDNFEIIGVPPPPVDYVYNNGWTPGDPSGVSTQFDNISVIAGLGTISNHTIANNVDVDLATLLLITPTASLDVRGTMDNDGTINMQSTSTSYSSLITNTMVGVGDFNYLRHVNATVAPGSTTGGNDLVSAPFTGLPFNVFRDSNPNLVSNASETLFLFGPFDKSTGTYVLYSDTETATLDPAVGYRAATDDNGTLTFSGDVNVNTVNIPILHTGPQFVEWNLIGNPYPTYIRLDDFLAANNSQFNTSVAGVYGYDGFASDGWSIWNLAYSLANPDAKMTPGQGFLVASKPGGGTVTFSPDMRDTGTTDDFIIGRLSNQSEEIAFLELQITNGTLNTHADFYFTNYASLGLDPGYDAGVFGGEAPSFAIYSHLVEENSGMDMAIQSVAYDDLNTEVIIPLGINAAQGQQLTISLGNSTLPEFVDVYLEDNETNTFTLLNSSNYGFVTDSNLNGTGRFFLRFTNNTLSTPDVEVNGLQIYALSDTNTVLIKGQLASETNVTLYDIQGRPVLTEILDGSSNSNAIDASGLSSGVYVVKLSNSTQQKTQKIIVK